MFLEKSMIVEYNPKLDTRQPCFSSCNNRPCILLKGHKSKHMSVRYRDRRGMSRLTWWYGNPSLEYGVFK